MVQPWTNGGHAEEVSQSRAEIQKFRPRGFGALGFWGFGVLGSRAQGVDHGLPWSCTLQYLPGHHIPAWLPVAILHFWLFILHGRSSQVSR